MTDAINTKSRLCESCALFGADYSKKYEKWINSSEGKRGGNFFIPYSVIDSYPGFPNVTRSGDAGCQLCIVIKKGLGSQGKLASLPWNRKKVQIKGGFKIHTPKDDQIREPARSLALRIFFDVHFPRYYYSFGFEVLSTNQVSSTIRPPVLPMRLESALCPQNINLIHGWLSECDLKHPSCKKGRIREFLPTRLICVKSDAVCLVETRYFSAEERRPLRYVALSHCWGPETDLQYKTASQNLQARLHSMVFCDLPLNFQDAISVCRSLGLDYLWIDSLCIVQDLPEDLATEMEVMLEVYSNAYLSISATCAATVQEGFLNRALRSEPTVIIPRKSVSKLSGEDGSLIMFPGNGCKNFYELWNTAVGNSPWNQRAWTLQEALVSARVLYFTQERLFFECSTLDCLEGSDISRGRPGMFPYNQEDHRSRSVNFLRHQDSLSFISDSLGPEKIAQVFNDYYSLIQIYTSRKLTFMEDKAAAFSSIISAITRITKTSSHHGILLSDLRRGLQWNVEFGRVLVQSPKLLELWPSWSWLSYPGNASYPFSISGGDVRNVSEEEQVMRAALDHETTQRFQEENSRSTDKRLCLKGFLIEAWITRKRDDAYDLRVHVKSKEIGKAEFDYDTTFPRGKRRIPVFLFSLGETESEKKTEKEKLDPDCGAFLGLLLHRHDAGSFKRIGIFQIHSGHYINSKKKDSRWIFQNAQRESVTLV